MKCEMRLSLAVVLALALMQWGCSATAVKSEQPGVGHDPVLEVKAIRVKSEDWTVSIPVSGSLKSKSIVEISAPR